MTREFYPVPVSVDDLMAQSRAIAGVDIVDHDIIEPLSILHRSLSEEAELHEKGAQAWAKRLLRLLTNRLRMQRDMARHPEIAEEVLGPQLFCTGFPRSGTTKTQSILAATGDFNWLPYWQTFNPSLFTGSRDESPEPRIREAEENNRWFEEASPLAKRGHAHDLHEPAEEALLYEHSFRGTSPGGYAQIPTYLRWCARQSFVPVAGFLRDAMKYLQWQGLQTTGKPWMLKTPLYVGLERELLKVFPDARLVMTHRDPANIIPSVCKASQLFHVPTSDRSPQGPSMLEGLASKMEQHLASRQQQPPLPVLDLHFDEICNAPDKALEKIYRHMGMTFTSEVADRAKRWDQENPMHKYGPFEYSLEEFDLTAQGIRDRMGKYHAFMAETFG